MAKNKTMHYCIRCGTPGKRENMFLCWKCCLIADHWGGILVGAKYSDIRAAELWQTENHKPHTHFCLELPDFAKICNRKTETIMGEVVVKKIDTE